MKKQKLAFCCQSKTIPSLFCAIIKKTLNFPVFSTRNDDIIALSALTINLKRRYKHLRQFQRTCFVKQKTTRFKARNKRAKKIKHNRVASNRVVTKIYVEQREEIIHACNRQTTFELPALFSKKHKLKRAKHFIFYGNNATHQLRV